MLDKYIVITYTIYNDKQLTKQKKGGCYYE